LGQALSRHAALTLTVVPQKSRYGQLENLKYKQNRPDLSIRAVFDKSRQRPTFAVTLSSALAGLTAVFGMGTGVTLPV
jgi:hypothetical protein